MNLGTHEPMFDIFIAKPYFIVSKNQEKNHSRGVIGYANITKSHIGFLFELQNCEPGTQPEALCVFFVHVSVYKF
jgi:hypothetical protein